MAKFVPQPELSLNDQMQIRREKLAALQAEGRDPFVQTKFDFNADSAAIKADYEAFEGKTVKVAGRLMSKRGQGKVMFCDLQDRAGRIQIFVKIDELGEEEYNRFKKYDIGDIVGVEGEVFKTKTEEISIRAKVVTLLSKSLLPLPNKFHGLTDKEARFRQRYVDLMVNPEVKRNFVIRSKFIKHLRNYLDSMGYIEVETPVLNTIAGGAAARPFVTHHNTLDIDMYMRIATELPLKRLIVGGMDRVYEVGRIFRNEGMDPKHNPEFTSIELYQAFTDFHGMMDLVEELYKRLAQKICGSMVIPYQGKQIDMGHWERLTMVEAVKKYSGVDFNDWKSDEDAIAAAKEHHVELPEVPTKGAILAEFFDAFVEDKLIQPTFITDYPREMSPLCKRHRSNPDLTERFELFVNGKELCNAYSELNDPIDQLERFQEQLRLSEKGDDEAMFIDMDFVRALEYGMPTCSGMGIGIDRLTMFMTDQSSIQDVLFFPQMRPEKKVVNDPAEAYTAIGVPEEWVPVIQKMGYLTVESLRKLAPGKFFNDLCGFNKKNKLGLKAPSIDEVKAWLN